MEAIAGGFDWNMINGGFAIFDAVHRGCFLVPQRQPTKNQVPTAELTAESMESWDESWHGGSSLKGGHRTPCKVAINYANDAWNFKGREDTKSPLADRAFFGGWVTSTNPSEAVSVWTEATSVLTRTYTKTYSHNYAHIYIYI